jgi:hypothetical protein
MEDTMTRHASLTLAAALLATTVAAASAQTAQDHNAHHSGRHANGDRHWRGRPGRIGDGAVRPYRGPHRLYQGGTGDHRRANPAVELLRRRAARRFEGHACR